MRSESDACKKRPALSRLQILLIVAASLVLLGILLVSVVNLYVKLTVSDSILSLDELDGSKSFDCVLILGAGLQKDGSPSHMLEDRIKTGVDVFKKVNADAILMSGDRSGDDYDEPSAMKKYAIGLGIDESRILIDNEGYSTYESIARVIELYGADNIVIITQEYHLFRALYIAEQSGIEAIGVSADLRTYRGQFYRDLREMLARVKDFLQCN